MSAWIRGEAVAFDAAVREAALALGAARAPVIAGLAADVDALRAAFSLGARIGASFDPLAAPSLYADLAALAGAGAVSTTPTELLQRADLVLAVGARALQSSIVAMARSSDPTIGAGAGTRRVLSLDSSTANHALAPTLGLVRALATGRYALDHALGDLASALSTARFGVAVYDPQELGDLGVEMLQGLAAELNETTRFFTLPLSDPWQGRSVLQVSAWTTGGGPRVGLGGSFPDHDPWRFDAARQAEAGEIDAVLWLAAQDAPRPAWIQDLPCVEIAGDADQSPGDVIFLVGVPGETSDGVIWDERRGNLAFASASTHTDRPHAAVVLRAIEEAIIIQRAD